MATPKTVTKTVDEGTSNAQVLSLDAKRKKLVQHYMEEEKIPVSISPFYAPYLGKTAMFSIQGISVYVPANGNTYKIPKTHAALVFKAIKDIDKRQQRLNRMSDIKENVESSIGALKF